MQVARSGHSCVLVVDQFNQKKIVVAAGYNNGGYLKSTEIYDLNKQVWTRGPDLPTTVYRSSMVNASPGSKYAAYLVGGIQGGSTANKIFAINKNMDQWNEVGRFTTPRRNHVALRIDACKV